VRDVSRVLGALSQALICIFLISLALDLPGARCPGAAIAKAFMIHGLRLSFLEVEAIVLQDVM
jgi:hypothetical protein